MAIWIDWKNKLERQADEISRMLSRFANGDFSGSLQQSGRPAERVAPALRNLQEQLAKNTAETGSLGAALAEMSKAHAAGAIDESIAVDRFSGTQREIALGINDLIASHVGLKMKIVDLITRYANDDFSTDIDRLPGKKGADHGGYRPREGVLPSGFQREGCSAAVRRCARNHVRAARPGHDR